MGRLFLSLGGKDRGRRDDAKAEGMKAGSQCFHAFRVLQWSGESMACTVHFSEPDSCDLVFLTI